MAAVSIARCAALAALLALAAPLGAETVRKALTFSDLVKAPATTDAQPAVIAPCSSWEGPSRASCDAYAKASFDHQVWVLQYRQNAYEAHASYTLYVFLLVCAI